MSVTWLWLPDRTAKQCSHPANQAANVPSIHNSSDGPGLLPEYVENKKFHIILFDGRKNNLKFIKYSQYVDSIRE